MEMGQEDENLIAKGKRTKRQKLQMISQNPNFTESDFEVFGQPPSFFNGGQSFHPIIPSNFSSSPPSNDDDDDDDMANCLILLAQGSPASDQPSSSSLGKLFMGAPEGQNGANKASRFCVYECKTCSRKFPSFQALGGHRSSHKKPAMAAAGGGGKKNPIYNEQQQFNNNNISSPFDQLRLSRSDYYSNKFKLINNNNKVHACSICGAEFVSGQALGGHMRRHRRGCGGALEDSGAIDRRRPKKQRSLLCLDLDLNLPAAPEDDKRDQSSAVVMATAALVGCHY